MSAGTLTTSYSYDALNRLETVADSEGRDYVHEYDSNGNRRKLTYPNSTEMSYVYDDLNRLTNLTTVSCSPIRSRPIGEDRTRSAGRTARHRPRRTATHVEPPPGPDDSRVVRLSPRAARVVLLMVRADSPKELLDLAGRSVLVTGAGAGIGSGIARRFAAAGAAVAVNYRRSADAARGVVEAIEAAGGRAVALQADVTRRGEVASLVEAASDALGGVDVLVNNAGLYPLHPLVEMDDEQWDAVVDSNLRSTFLCTQAVARHMRATGRQGAIVNVASIEATNPAPAHSHYNAAKGGVLMHTRAAALELGPSGIRVNAVSPGLIWREGLDADWPDGVDRYRRAAPLGRLGEFDDVADACLFLASPLARWITGSELIVDGGVMCHQIF